MNRTKMLLAVHSSRLSLSLSLVVRLVVSTFFVRRPKETCRRFSPRASERDRQRVRERERERTRVIVAERDDNNNIFGHRSLASLVFDRERYPIRTTHDLLCTGVLKCRLFSGARTGPISRVRPAGRNTKPHVGSLRVRARTFSDTRPKRLSHKAHNN